MKKERKYLTKNDIVSDSGISIHTLNSWIKTNKPLKEKDYIKRGNTKLFSKDYVISIFESAGKLDILKENNTSNDEGSTSKYTSKNNQESELIIELRNQISFLKEQIQFLQKQLEDKDETNLQLQTLVSQQQVLSKQQNQLLLENSDIKEEKRKKLFGIF